MLETDQVRILGDHAIATSHTYLHPKQGAPFIFYFISHK